MKVEVGKSETEQCIVRVGPLARSDPDSEIHVVVSTGPGDKDWERVKREYVEGRKIIKYDLPDGKYHVMIVGDKIAGVVNTAGYLLDHPWNVFLETPQEHVKDYQRISIPTGGQPRPQISNVAQAVKKSLH